jgi:hypothetical protein
VAAGLGVLSHEQMEREKQRDDLRGTATVTKMSPKISQEIGKDGKYRKG